MIDSSILFTLAGIGLFTIGLRGTLLHQLLITRLISLNVCGAGVFLMFIAIAQRNDSHIVDPVPHALVLTGLVVAVSAMAMALALGRKLQEYDDE